MADLKEKESIIVNLNSEMEEQKQQKEEQE